MLLLPILVLEVIRLPSIPVCERDRLPVPEPDEGAFLRLVRSGCPEVLVAEANLIDMLLQRNVLLFVLDGCESHPVRDAELVGSVPVGLEILPNVVPLTPQSYKRH